MAAAAADVLRFWSGSADAPPGRGAGERVGDAGLYRDLAARRDWRRALSNFHAAEFEYGGRTYRTVEHAFHAAKIRLRDPAAADAFTVESGSALGRGGGLDARRQRMMVRLPRDTVLAWDAASPGVMAGIAAAKYAQCPEAAAVLAATRDAQLWHAGPRIRPVRFLHLESIREGLPRGE